MKDNHRVIFITSILNILFLSILIVSNNSRLPKTRNLEVYHDQIKPKLSAIEYKANPLPNHKLEIRSLNYAFKIVAPQKYEISKGGGFDSKFPENQSVSLGARNQEEQSNLVYNVTIRLLNNQDVYDIAEKETYYFETEFGKTNPENIKIDHVLINNAEGVSFQYRNAFDQDVIVYIFNLGDLYYAISATPDSSKHFTSSQFREIQETVNTFEFI